MEIIQLVSALVVFAASLIPFYFLLKIKSKKQLVLSSFLGTVLLVFGIHSIIETTHLIEYDILLKVCFIISLSCLIAVYFVFRTKKPQSFNGIFGIAMLIVFGFWVTTEIMEYYIIHKETIDTMNSFVMIGFSAFIIARFFWFRKDALYPPKIYHI
jgi:hypothetical protein